MIEENGASPVVETLTPLKMTIFPRASVHTMVNLGKWWNQVFFVLAQQQRRFGCTTEERAAKSRSCGNSVTSSFAQYGFYDAKH